MSNREIALAWLADLLSQLYENWPKRIDLDPMKTMERVGLHPESSAEMIELWLALGRGLQEEGIVRVGPKPLGRSLLRGAVLTMKGFHLLGKPMPGAPGKSFGAELGELAKQAGKDATKDGMKSVSKEAAEWAGAFLGSLWKSASF